MNTPLSTDAALQNEIYRIAAPSGVAGAGVGETLNSAYFDPSGATGTYLEVGFFRGTATGTINTEHS